MWGTSDRASRQASKKIIYVQTCTLLWAYRVTAHYWPLCSQLCVWPRSSHCSCPKGPKKHQGTHRLSWGKGSKWFRWQNHPYGNHWRWKRAAVVPEEGEGGDAGKKGLIKTSLGETSEQLPHPPAECHCEESRAGCTHRAARHWHSHLCSVTALGAARAPVPVPVPAQAISRLCHLPGPHPPASAAWVCTGWKRALSMTVWCLGSAHSCFVTILWFWCVDGAPARHWVALGGNSVAQRSLMGAVHPNVLSAPQQHLPSSAAPGFTHSQAFGKFKECHWSTLKQQVNSFRLVKYFLVNFLSGVEEGPFKVIK